MTKRSRLEASNLLRSTNATTLPIVQGENYKITLERVNLMLQILNGKNVDRPIIVEGVIQPTSTKNRGATPNPISIENVLKTTRKINPDVTQANIFKTVMLESDYICHPKGSPDRLVFECEKGHIFALCNGGPNISENIIPQLGKGFQQYGEWRQLEARINTKAKELLKIKTIRGTPLTLFFKVTLEYLPMNFQAEKKLYLSYQSHDYKTLLKIINLYTNPISYQCSYIPCVADLPVEQYINVETYFNTARLINDRNAEDVDSTQIDSEITEYSRSLRLKINRNRDSTTFNTEFDKRYIPLPFDTRYIPLPKENPTNVLYNEKKYYGTECFCFGTPSESMITFYESQKCRKVNSSGDYLRRVHLSL